MFENPKKKCAYELKTWSCIGHRIKKDRKNSADRILEFTTFKYITWVAPVVYVNEMVAQVMIRSMSHF